MYIWMQPENQSLRAKHKRTPTIPGRTAEAGAVEPLFLLLEAERKLKAVI